MNNKNKKYKKRANIKKMHMNNEENRGELIK